MDKDKVIEELQTEIVSLKIRLARIEEFLKAFPSISNYLPDNSGLDGKDEIFDDAVKVVREHDKASASLLQRRFHIGFNRAARLLEQLEKEGIVGAGEGAEPRKVLKKEE